MPRELRDGVWWLDLRGVNAYLVDDGGTVTLIDAGPPWQPGGVLDALVELGYALTDLDRALVTHFDADHVGGLSRLAGLDVDVYVGAGDAALLTGRDAPDWRTPKGALQTLLGPLVRDSPVEVRPLTDGDEIGSFTVYETPGHTNGHVAYVSEALDAAFVGDLVVESDGRLDPSPWYMSVDADRVRASVRDLAARAPAVEVLGMGHGVPFQRGGTDRLADLADRLDRR